jgi:ABC-type lipoprotein export system ATPase subunit
MSDVSGSNGRVVHLDDVVKSFPLGEDDEVTVLKGINLEVKDGLRRPTATGSHCQKAANDPELVVADEPTGNLDSRTAADVFALFNRLVEEGRTMLMVTQKLFANEP